MPRRCVIALSSAEDTALRALLTDFRLGYRASIVLQTAQGSSATKIARVLHMGRVNVVRWQKRYLAHGIDGLQDQRVSGRRPKVTPEIIAEISSLRGQGLSFGAIAKTLGLGKTTVFDALTGPARKVARSGRGTRKRTGAAVVLKGVKNPLRSKDAR